MLLLLLVLVALVLMSTRGGSSMPFLHAAGAAGAQETDTDSDTMPDAWETFFGLNPNDAGDATGDPDSDGRTNAQEFADGRHPNGVHMRYFAEGSTGYFDTSVGVLNLSETETAHVAIALLNEVGGVVSHRFTLAARARQTVSINEVLGISAAVAIVVESDVPVAADRWMTWGTTGIGASLDSGAPAPATTWYFAEGATGPFLLYYLFENPGMTPATVTIQYLIEARPPVTTTHILPPQSRTTIPVNQDHPALEIASVGSVITSTAPIFAERAMYVNAGGALGGGSASAGSNQLSTQWYFGEGSTGPFFQCFLSLLNPGATDATATVTYHMSDGSTASKAYPVPAGGRRTVYFNGEAETDPALASLATGPVWFTVNSTQPILGERAMWWRDWPWYEGHSAPGNTMSALSWAIPEGRDGGATREQTYVLIGNTTTTPGQVRLTLIPDTGASSTREMPIAAGERLTVNIGNVFGLTEARFSVIVESLGTTPVPLAVDYARYRSVNGVPFSGGGAAPAVPMTGLGDTAPSVTTTTPAANATGVAVDANLTVTFNEPVNAGAGAFVLECPAATPVTLTNLTTSPATTFTLEPATDLPISTACTLRIVASQITDADTIDPPDAMAADVVVPFTTSACATITVSPATVPGGTVNQPYGPVTFTQTGGTAPVAWSLSAGTLPGGMSLSAAGVLAGTPTASGSFTFTATVTDANSCTGSAPRTLSILSGPNQAPSFTPGPNQTSLEDAGPQAVAWATGISPGPSPDETGQVVTFNVTGNTNAALFSIAPAISSAGLLSYTAAPNANGTATITVELQDNGGTAGGGDDTSAPQTFTITITPVNDAPSFVKGADPIAVVEDSGLTTLIGWATAISAGPTDETGQALTFTLTGNTNAALFAVLPAIDPATGTLTFTLQPDVSGTTTLTWTLSDNGGGANTSAPQTVVINVGAVNDPPVAVDDAATTDEDTVLTVPPPGVLANDIDPDAGDTRTVVAVNGLAANVGTQITLASGALLTLNPDGSGAYDPTAVAAFQALATGQSATDTFTYTMQDAAAVLSTATVTITITGVSDGPAIDLDADNSSTATGADYQFTFTDGDPARFVADATDATITDVDSTALSTLTVTLTNLLDPTFEVLDVDLTGFPNFAKAYDTTTDPTRGVLAITTTTAQPIADFQTLLRRVTYQNTDGNPNTTARVITVVANDGTASGNTATSTVTIVAVNNPPTADNDAYSVAEGGTLNIAAPGVLDGDVDAEGDAPITAVLVMGPVNASAFTLNADGSFTYTHNGSETTTDAFTYQASAGGQLSTVATVTITITNVNDPPTAVDDANTTTEDAPVTAGAPGVLANDTDPDPGDTKTVISVNGVPANVGVATATVNGGTVTLNANGSYTYNPGTAFQSLGAGQTGTDTFTYTLQDAAGAPSNVATVTITVTGLNDAPVVAAGAGAAAFTEDGPAVAVAPALTVTDADDTNLESATVQITANYQNGQDVLAFTNQAGITGAFNAATGTLTLTGSSSVANYQTALQSVTYTNSSQNPGTLARTVQFQVNDGTVNSNTSTRDVTVAAVNDAPVVTAGTILTFTEGDVATPIAGTLTATDADDTNLESATVQITGNYANGQDLLGFTNQAGITGVFNAATGTLTLTGTSAIANYQAALRTVSYFNGSDNPSTLARTVTFVVNDGDLNSVGATSTINVIAVNDAPLLTTATITYSTVGNTQLHVQGATLPGVVSVSDASGALAKSAPTDVDGPAAPVMVPQTNFDTGEGTLTINADGSFTYLPDAGFTGIDTFTVQVTDTVTPVTLTVNINVGEVVWYVNNQTGPNNAAGGDGRSTNAWETLAAAEAASTPNSTIFIFNGLTATTPLSGSIALKTGQKLLGEGVGLTIVGFPALVPAGTQPRIVATGDAVTVVANTANGDRTSVQIRGLNLASTGGNAIEASSANTQDLGVRISENIVSGSLQDGIIIPAASTGTATLAIHDNAITAGGTGLQIARSSTGTVYITAFHNNVVSGDTGASGIVITGPSVIFDATPLGTLDPVAGGATVIGAPGNAVGVAGIQLTSVTGALDFTDLDIVSGNGAALSVLGTGTFTGAAGTRITAIAGAASLAATGGAAASLSDLTTDLQLAGLSSANSTGNGVSLTNVAGTFTAPTTATITNATTADFNVSGGAATITYNGTITDDVGQLVSIANTTGGAKSFTGAITDGNDGDGNGISLTSNTGATITFSGGLLLSTGTNAAFTATGGGTINVCDENPCNPAAGALVNTITTTTGTALNVANTTIGTGGLTFRSISANGAPNGIILNQTGTTAGLTVSGTGPAGSGGTIQNITSRGASFINAVNVSLTDINFTNANTTDGGTSDGVIGSNTDENAAINLQNVTQVDLTDLVIDGTAQHGINGSNVTDLDITNTTIQNTGDEVWESNIYLWDLKGLASAARTSVFSGLNLTNDSGQFNIWIQNNDGTNDRPGEKDRVEISNSTFTRNGNNALISDNISVFNSGTGNTQVVVSNATFTAAATCGSPAFAGACVSDNIQVDAGNSAAFDFDLSTGNNFAAGNAGQAAVNVSASGAGQGTFNVRNITTSVRAGQGINVSLTTADPAASLRGTIANNSISTNVPNNPGSGIQMVLEGAGTMVVDVNNNTINGNATNQFDYGIRGGARAGTGTADFQINNNSVPSAEAAGVWFFAGNATGGETSRTCVNFVSNLMDGFNVPAIAFTDYFVEMYTGTTFRIQGLTGSGTNAANVGAFISSTDDDPAAGDPEVDAGSGTTVNYTNAVCATP